MANIYSSHGSHPDDGRAFLIDENGVILETTLTDSWEQPIPDRFDVNEFRQAYGILDDHIDILDIGYWNPDGKYIEAEPDFREHAFRVLQERAQDEVSNVP